jgi:serine/threonine protein kinase
MNRVQGLEWMHQMVCGLSYLHSLQPPVFHRDLKSLNLLVAGSGEIKLTDFGLSRADTAENSATMLNVVGTLKWMAPEVMMGEKYTAKADMYSIAIVFWEIVARLINEVYCEPYHDHPDAHVDFRLLAAVFDKK